MRYTNRIIAALATLILLSATFIAQPSAFNFQGRLNDGGVAANGNYDLRFRFYTAITGGTNLGQTDRLNLPVINGVFSTTLDAGTSMFQTHASVFLEIAVRPAGSPNAFVVLGARQQLLAVPYAVRSITSSNADNATNAANATTAATATNATTAQNALSLGGVSAAEYARINFTNPGELRTSGKLEVGGNAVQALTTNGLPKAMAYVDGVSGGIIRCYNGTTGQATGNCGFHSQVAPGLSGVYQINFNFDITARFVQVTTVHRIAAGGGIVNTGGDFDFLNNTTVSVFTFFTGNTSDTAPFINFMILLF